jgi:hypothetical protein
MKLFYKNQDGTKTAGKEDLKRIQEIINDPKTKQKEKIMTISKYWKISFGNYIIDIEDISNTINISVYDNATGLLGITFTGDVNPVNVINYLKNINDKDEIEISSLSNEIGFRERRREMFLRFIKDLKSIKKVSVLEVTRLKPEEYKYTKYNISTERS